MIRLPLLVLLAVLAYGQQTAPAPPAGVDAALRARITAFYDLMVAHQFRKAEELVAPDSRDIYYDREKPRFLAYELTSVVYTDNFTRAEVVTTIKMPPINQMIPVSMNSPVTSIWRLIDGAWYWTIPRINVTDILKTMTGDTPTSPDAKAAPVLPPMPTGLNLPGGMGRPESMPMAGAGEMAPLPKFTIDRTDVKLTGSDPVKVTIANTGSTPMKLFLLGQIPGIETKFDRPDINGGEKAVLTLKAGKGAKDGTLLIGVTGTQEMISLPVFVK